MPDSLLNQDNMDARFPQIGTVIDPPASNTDKPRAFTLEALVLRNFDVVRQIAVVDKGDGASYRFAIDHFEDCPVSVRIIV